jgi:DNA-binding IclR family transcriptional regulator
MNTLVQPVPDERRGIQSVDAALEILQTLAAAGAPLTLTAIAKSTGQAASTVHRHLVSLQRGELVAQEASTGRYDLGPGALRLGLMALRRRDALGLAQTEAGRLAAETGETCFVSIWTAHGPLIVRWFHGRRTLITSAGVGSLLPLLESSAGRVFAAYLPRHLVEQHMAECQPPLAYADAAPLLEQVRTEAFGWIDGLIVTGLRGLSVPVRDHQGDIECVITLLGTDLSLVRFPNTARHRLEEAGRIASRALGFNMLE